MKTLVAGWFSFSNGHATAGDILAKDVLCQWLTDARIDYDVALAPPFMGGIQLRDASPTDYSLVVFVCGPFDKGELEAELLSRFQGCRLIGLNLSMSEPIESWNPFDLLIERDSSRSARPDLVFASSEHRLPVVGICLVEEHPGAATDDAEAAIQRLVGSRRAALVPVDTRLDTNAAGLRDAAEVESLIARMDLLITTRLHGTVLALKNGVPVVAIDPIPGGSKITRQAEVVGWPCVLQVDRMTDEALQRAFDYCLTDEARAEARRCAARAIRDVELARAMVLDAVHGAGGIEDAFRQRTEHLTANTGAAPIEGGPRRRWAPPAALSIPGWARSWFGVDPDA